MYVATAIHTCKLCTMYIIFNNLYNYSSYLTFNCRIHLFKRIILNPVMSSPPTYHNFKPLAVITAGKSLSLCNFPFRYHFLVPLLFITAGKSLSLCNAEIYCINLKFEY